MPASVTSARCSNKGADLDRLYIRDGARVHVTKVFLPGMLATIRCDPHHRSIGGVVGIATGWRTCTTKFAVVGSPRASRSTTRRKASARIAFARARRERRSLLRVEGISRSEESLEEMAARRPWAAWRRPGGDCVRRALPRE